MRGPDTKIDKKMTEICRMMENFKKVNLPSVDEKEFRNDAV